MHGTSEVAKSNLYCAIHIHEERKKFSAVKVCVQSCFTTWYDHDTTAFYLFNVCLAMQRQQQRFETIYYELNWPNPPTLPPHSVIEMYMWDTRVANSSNNNNIYLKIETGIKYCVGFSTCMPTLKFVYFSQDLFLLLLFLVAEGLIITLCSSLFVQYFVKGGAFCKRKM